MQSKETLQSDKMSNWIEITIKSTVKICSEHGDKNKSFDDIIEESCSSLNLSVPQLNSSWLIVLLVLKLVKWMVACFIWQCTKPKAPSSEVSYKQSDGQYGIFEWKENAICLRNSLDFMKQVMKCKFHSALHWSQSQPISITCIHSLSHSLNHTFTLQHTHTLCFS